MIRSLLKWEKWCRKKLNYWEEIFRWFFKASCRVLKNLWVKSLEIRLGKKNSLKLPNNKKKTSNFINFSNCFLKKFSRNNLQRLINHPSPIHPCFDTVACTRVLKLNSKKPRKKIFTPAFRVIWLFYSYANRMCTK